MLCIFIIAVTYRSGAVFINCVAHQAVEEDRSTGRSTWCWWQRPGKYHSTAEIYSHQYHLQCTISLWCACSAYGPNLAGPCPGPKLAAHQSLFLRGRENRIPLQPRGLGVHCFISHCLEQTLNNTGNAEAWPHTRLTTFLDYSCRLEKELCWPI